MLRKKKEPGPSYTNGYHSNGTKTQKTKFDFASRKGTKKFFKLNSNSGAKSFSTSLNVDLSQDIKRISSISTIRYNNGVFSLFGPIILVNSIQMRRVTNFLFSKVIYYKKPLMKWYKKHRLNLKPPFMSCRRSAFNGIVGNGKVLGLGVKLIPKI